MRKKLIIFFICFLVLVVLLAVPFIPKKIYLVNATTNIPLKSEHVRLIFHSPCWDKPYRCESKRTIVFEGFTGEDGSITIKTWDTWELTKRPFNKFGDYFNLVTDEVSYRLSKEMFNSNTKVLRLDPNSKL